MTQGHPYRFLSLVRVVLFSVIRRDLVQLPEYCLPSVHASMSCRVRQCYQVRYQFGYQNVAHHRNLLAPAVGDLIVNGLIRADGKVQIA